MIATAKGTRVDARDVKVRFGRNQILKGLSLSVFPGECVGILGASGCGKSTLLKVLAGLLAPTEGEVRLSGDTGPCGFVPQDDIVHTALRVESALGYSARLRLGDRLDRKQLEARVDEVVRILGLEERRRVKIGRLSGGQRKRVSIGVELLTSPGLMFLDEPTSGLDPALEEHFMELFRKLADGGRTVLLTTHVLQSLHRLDLVGVMAAGRLAYYGPPGEMLAFFGVSEAREVYAKLAQGDALANRFQASLHHRKYVLDRLQS